MTSVGFLVTCAVGFVAYYLGLLTAAIFSGKAQAEAFEEGRESAARDLDLAHAENERLHKELQGPNGRLWKKPIR